MRKYILPSVLILALASGLGIAQSINKAVQLSQDTANSPFSVDSFNNLYFASHILSFVPYPGRPAPTITGTGTPTVSGNDTMGLITMGASATTATVVFGTAYGSIPNCVVNAQNSGAGTVSPISYTLATTSIAITQGSTSSNKYNYLCMSAS